MSQRHANRPSRVRRGAAAVTMILVMVFTSLVIVAMVLGGAHDQDLSVARLSTIRAFYAAEAGINMALREFMQNNDEDADGEIGTISNDGVTSNDPLLNSARVYVESTIAAGHTILRAHGSAGDAKREFETTVVGQSGGGAGLLAEYFSAPGAVTQLSHINWSATPTLTTLASPINFASTTGQAWPGGPTNEWGRRYTGKVAIPTAGMWTFYTQSDDGSKVWIDETLVVNNDGLHSMQTQSGAITLSAGLHDFEVQWFEHTGAFGLNLYWSGPGVSAQTIIPATALSH